MRTLASRMRLLAQREQSSVNMTAEALAAATDPAGEGKRTFTRVYEEQAIATAEQVDQRRANGESLGPLAGIPVSIKDLFDVKGEATLAGSIALSDASPAEEDAAVVARLRSTGAVIVGRTNMTEFAYSGLGINPHYGTPLNPWDRQVGRIPGGSSSGSAISVTDGMAAVAIGTDTGGSVRIPAALCGLTGFKPTMRRFSTAGVLPLSPALDSVGVIAPTVQCCATVDSILTASPARLLADIDIRTLRIGVLQGYVLDGLDPHVARHFSDAVSVLEKAGAMVFDVDFAELSQIPEVNAQGGFAAVESYAWHQHLLERFAGRYDPRVLSRILRGRAITEQTHDELLAARRRIVMAANQQFVNTDVWILPTVPLVAPLVADLVNDDNAYYAANAAMLRNPSVFNFLDACALSVPCHLPGEAPVGLMVAAPGGADEHLLRVGTAIEKTLAHAGRAIVPD
ncbi:amidase [Noviherbaspirillum saxi]|uniref:Amidase n=2 Tax=Noviherbaspirillum saxi TaxID=2320863 RepID=A0A3A3FKC3_9BURK|nr:amidase [Noviherbaspirillum saxi]